jgi:hypothetical protein
MSFYIFKPLAEIYHRTNSGEEYLFEESLTGTLRYLRDHGYIEWVSISGLRVKQNLIGVIKLTSVGQGYVELREAFERNHV